MLFLSLSPRTRNIRVAYYLFLCITCFLSFNNFVNGFTGLSAGKLRKDNGFIQNHRINIRMNLLPSPNLPVKHFFLAGLLITSSVENDIFLDLKSFGGITDTASFSVQDQSEPKDQSLEQKQTKTPSKRGKGDTSFELDLLPFNEGGKDGKSDLEKMLEKSRSTKAVGPLTHG
mmetsp:Transcript_37023/g.48752  ORF Transcript_37023/g.48752 Transcript_37023/m.48752 type:complete len:173 (+) Transcript_37023:65-583(+)